MPDADAGVSFLDADAQLCPPGIAKSFYWRKKIYRVL
jgi:hypothetical protein